MQECVKSDLCTKCDFEFRFKLLLTNEICLCSFFVSTGTSDEHITVIENLQQYRPDGAILVTTPQVQCYLTKQKCSMCIAD